MAFQFNTPFTRFFTQFRNGPAFTLNLSEYTTTIRGNVGDLVQLNQSVVIDIAFNLTESITAVWDSTPSDGSFQAIGINFTTEGFFVGAEVDVIQGGDTMASTIEWIDGGTTFNTLHLDKTNLGALADGPHTDVIVRMKSRPSRARLKYGLVKQDTSGVDDTNYQSPIDGTQQAYEIITIPTDPSFGTMIPLGPPNISWNLTDLAEISFIATTGFYFHEYQIKHTFRIPYFVEGQETSLVTLVSPDPLTSTDTYKYVSELRFGNNSALFGTFNQLGAEGDVGYFDENYNGKPLDFIITSETIVNAAATDTLEATELNTVTWVIDAVGAATPFVAGQKVIVNHSRLPSAIEYQFKTTPYDDIWFLDTLEQVAGAGAVDSDRIKNLVVTFNSSTKITVVFDIVYSPAQQTIIAEGNRWLLWLSVGEVALGVDLENNVNLRTTSVYSKNNNIPGILTGHTPLYYNSLNTYLGGRFSTDWLGWDFDFIGARESVNMTQDSIDDYNEISNIESQIVAVNGDEKFILTSKFIPLGTITTLFDGGSRYQIFNNFALDTFRLPDFEPLNITAIESTPPFPAGFQNILIQTSIPRIPWQEWISNLGVAAEFYDATEANNNQNFRTSNYSEVNGWSIYHQWFIKTKKIVRTIVDDPIKLISIVTTIETATDYELRSDPFIISEIDTNGGVFSGDINAFDLLGDPTDNIFQDANTLIVIDFPHNLGTPPASSVGGYVSIQKKNSEEAPWQLHTDRDWTHEDNPLTPSDTLLTGNEAVVEVISTLDLFQFIFFTNKDNLIEGQEYTIYGRLEKLNFQ